MRNFFLTKVALTVVSRTFRFEFCVFVHLSVIAQFPAKATASATNGPKAEADRRRHLILYHDGKASAVHVSKPEYVSPCCC